MRTSLLALVAMLLLLLPGEAAAHAVLIESIPESGARLDRAPSLVLVRFNEPVQAEFTPLQVQDAAGNRIDNGNAKINPLDPTVVTVGLPPLSDGFYTATYRVTSADGHPVVGSIGFTVGEGVAPALPNQPIQIVPVGFGLVRGLTLALAITIAGLVTFFAWVWAPSAGAPLPPWLGRVALVLAFLFGVAAIAEVASHAMRATGEPLSLSLWLRALATRTGRLWLIRVALTVVSALALGAVGRLRGPWSRLSAPWAPWLLLLPGAALLGSFSLQSHAAAAGNWALLSDWLHLLALAPWAGGVAGFTLVAATVLRPLPTTERTAILSVAVPRFSRLAVAAILVLSATGLYGALLHIEAASSLLATAYGRALLVKLGLFLPVLALGGYHLLRRGRGPFCRTMMVEAMLVGAVFLAAGYLSLLPPARVESWARLGPYEDQAVVQGLTVGLRIEPNRVGMNRYEITLIRSDGEPEVGAGLSLRADMVDHTMGTQNLTPKEGAPGVYAGDQLILSMEGRWRIEVAILTHQGREIRHPFLVFVPPAIAP